jgi:threonylcarbamoyladenosine tRNA methylthiotransferase MtaB
MRVCFTHLGCKLNQAETEAMARDFRAAGHLVVESLAEADLHVVNSCTVTAEAARGSRQAARRGGRSARPVRTVLVGCYATAEPAEAARLAGVDLVVGNLGKDRLLERVHERFPEAVPGGSREPSPCGAPDREPAWETALGHTRALVKIEDGCDVRCAFCIIPATRGRQRSRPRAAVVAEVRRRAAEGYREVVLSGVQISAYRDAGGGGLFELVRAVLAEGGVERLRLTSIAPWSFDERLLGLFADPRLCRHFHLSLQSGATPTLRRMRRPYTADQYAALLGRVRAAVPAAAVTTDVIVGFPGETDEEAAASLAFVAAAGFARIHVFPYSARPGTPAAAMPGQVATAAKRERMAAMLAVAAEAEREFRRARLGRRETVLWERPKEGLAQGLTDTYLRVVCRAPLDLRNRFAEVRLVELVDGGLRGELTAEAAVRHSAPPPLTFS